MASARTPLLAAPRRDGIGKRAATALAVAAVAGLGLVGNGYGTAPLLALARRDAVNEGFEAALLSPGETVVAPLVAVETWACGGRGDAVPAYTYWRYGLCGPRASARAGQAARVTSYRYDGRQALLSALAEGKLGAGAVVWVTVTSEALDTDFDDFDTLQRAYGVPRASLQRGVVGDLDGESATALDTMCVYQYTPDIVKRSTLLRALFAYGKPLVLVLAGDSACRLELPATHHAVVLANDGAPTSADLWFPEGLEGLENPEDAAFWQPAAARNAEKLTSATPAGLDARPFLFDAAMSVNGRKPSRQALVTWLRSGGASELEALATKAELAVRFNSTVVDMPRTSPTGATFDDPAFSREDFSAGSAPGFAGDGASVFALAPAGDTWTSGRVLEALLTGAIPVVDATYRSDGGVSAKGCGDAAAFWQRGVDGAIRGAPFVFVDDWADLPKQLEAFGATDSEKLRAKLADVQAYRDEVEAYLRGSLLGLAADRSAAAATTACATTPLAPGDRDGQLAAEAAYYGRDWYGSFVDTSALYTSGCSQTMHTQPGPDGTPEVIAQKYAHCYDAACAPPSVAAFSCAEV
ncbi:hypothetical protein JL721_9288 [Aureococcus anophagefferens]|nr:hypothetical protein JL721_9288 [Aureococcus anophagefferens]